MFLNNIFSKKIREQEIYPDEIFLDAKNIPQFDKQQFEGRLEKPISKKAFFLLSIFFASVIFFFFAKTFYLQIAQGGAFAERAEKNSLKQEILFPPRAVIKDRTGVKLAWEENGLRKYTGLKGFSHILGYTGLPSPADLESADAFLPNALVGKEGVEKKYENLLRGERGVKLVERDSYNNIVSESAQNEPSPSDDLVLAIDSRIQSQFFKIIESVISERVFSGGAGVIMDVSTGEIISLVSWPEYDSRILSAGEPKEEIQNFFQDKNKPFLNRAISGLYAPGSILKPIVALGALNEGTVSSDRQIFSAGSISIPNPFFPDKKSVFYDWKAHGWVDMRRALAVSSDVYFYEIGGGYEGVKGLGIKRIGEYSSRFGLDSKTGIDLNGESAGVIPSPELKEKNNPNDPVWRIGDTYNASIGQGDFQITPIEAAVYASALANNGKILQPRLFLNGDIKQRQIDIPENYFNVVKEGMRMAVAEGTASALNVPGVAIAAKTGTAEVGSAKKYVNSLVIGFFPYEKPRYSFAVVLEKGPYHNVVGAPYAMRQLIDWMSIYTPEYLK